jgi:lysophospholipase L1-like esterase
VGVIDMTARRSTAMTRRRRTARVWMCTAAGVLVWMISALPAAAQVTGPALTGPYADVVALQKALDSANSRLADWPNLGRFREANLELPLPAPNQPRVVFLGDSITDNWNNPGFGGFFPGKPYINRGISGQTTPQMLLRFRADVLALKPAVVVLLAGTNDIAGNTGTMSLEMIEDNYETMAELARAHGVKMVFASIMPVSDYNKDASGAPVVRTKQRQPEKIAALNAWLKDYAQREGHVYLDYCSVLADEKGFLKADLAEDGLHPNAKGYALIAPLAEQAIAAALKSRR